MRNFWYKYKIWIVITVVFVLFIVLFAKNSVISAIAVKRRINEMEKERSEYREKAQADSTFLENLKSDEFLEKFARETYYMKARGEEIYIVED